MAQTTLKYYILLLSLMLAACGTSNDDLPPQTNEEASLPILYNARAHTHETRTRGEKGTRASDLTEFYDNFMVRSFKTLADGVTKQEVMPNYTVTFNKNRNEWQYEGLTSSGGGEQFLKFWDLSASSYTFAAVTPLPNNAADAPYASKETRVTIGNDGDDTNGVEQDGEINIRGIKGNVSSIGDNSGNSSGAPDWMVARTVRRGINNAAKLLDYDDIVENFEDFDNVGNIDKTTDNTSAVFAKPQAPFADVPLMFRHILARVDFMAYATRTINVSKFKVYISDDTSGDEIINQGNYTTRTDVDGNIIGWYDMKAASKTETGEQQDPKCFGDYHYLPTAREVGTDPEYPRLLASHVEIPQEWLSPGRELKIKIITTELVEGYVYQEGDDPDDKFVSFTGTIILTPENNGSNSWKENYHYTYILKIDAEGESEIILFAVNMDKWKWQEGSSTEDSQTDW